MSQSTFSPSPAKSCPAAGAAPGPTAITAAFLDRILAFLAPLFLIGAQDDLSLATETAMELLDSYGARTNREIRLAALVIAFSIGALDSLGRSAAQDLAVNQILRLRGNANSLHRAAHRSEEALERLHAAEAEPAEKAEPETLPASIETVDLVAFTRPAPLSRQQRRAAERQAEKARQRQLEEARRATCAEARLHMPPMGMQVAPLIAARNAPLVAASVA